MDYVPSIPNVLYAYDVPCLVEFIGTTGWGTLQPCKDLIREDKEFWRHWWKTNMVDSEEFDTLYGPREEVNYLEDDADNNE